MLWNSEVILLTAVQLWSHTLTVLQLEVVLWLFYNWKSYSDCFTTLKSYSDCFTTGSHTLFHNSEVLLPLWTPQLESFTNLKSYCRLLYNSEAILWLSTTLLAQIWITQLTLYQSALHSLECFTTLISTTDCSSITLLTHNSLLVQFWRLPSSNYPRQLLCNNFEYFTSLKPYYWLLVYNVAYMSLNTHWRLPSNCLQQLPSTNWLHFLHARSSISIPPPPFPRS
jgi:hypothetical protein